MTLCLLKVHLQTFLSMPITQKCQISSCDSILLGVRYVDEVTDNELGDRVSIAGRLELFG